MSKDKKVIAEISAERSRQVKIGWTPEHDNRYPDGTLAKAAASYAVGGGLFYIDKLQIPMQVWPYRWEWKPKTKRQDLIRAGALIVAEIERLDRLDLLEKGE